ncbi:MAG: 50S ribosomal protein L4 [Candidatus Eremiobacteraeota bacterium]|nr:50S ribosomal protein L4 [Candidatus Eremiobacteraeota bacterium]
MATTKRSTTKRSTTKRSTTKRETTKRARAGAKKSRKTSPAVTKTADMPAVFQTQPKLSLLHEAVVRHLANRRAGTADTKTRDEVSGGGRKPWRQKGTGRARAGSNRSPLWRTGGVVFGPHPRSFAVGMNKRARRSALAMAVGVKADAGALSIIDAAGLKPAKTKDLTAVLWSDGKDDSVLIVLDLERDVNAPQIRLAARNLKRAHVLGHNEVSVHALLGHDRALFSQHALDALAEVCGA